MLDELSALLWGASLFGGKITGTLNSGLLGNLSPTQLSQLFVTWRSGFFLPKYAQARLALLDALLKGITFTIHPSHLQQAHHMAPNEKVRTTDQQQIQAWLKRRIAACRKEATGTLNSNRSFKPTTSLPILCGNPQEICGLNSRSRSSQLRELKRTIESELYLEALPGIWQESFRGDWLPFVSLLLADSIKNHPEISAFLSAETEKFADFEWEVFKSERDIQNLVQQVTEVLDNPQTCLGAVQIIDFDIDILRQELREWSQQKVGLSVIDDELSRETERELPARDPKVETVLKLLENSQEREGETSAFERRMARGKIQDNMPSVSPKSNRQSEEEQPVVLTGLPVPSRNTSNGIRPHWKCLNTLTGHSDSVVSVVFGVQTPENRQRSSYTLVSGSWDKSINIWQLKSSGRTHGMPHTLRDNSASVYSVALSQDHQYLASGCVDYRVRLWHLPTSRRVNTLLGHSVSIYSVAFSPDGRLLASGSGDQTIKIWQVETGELVGTLIGHSGFIYSIAFSPDGELLVSGSEDKTIKIWQVKSLQLVRTLIGNSAVTSVSLSRNGHVLASGSMDETIKLWHLKETASEGGTRPAPTRTLRGHTAQVLCVAIAPRLQILASGSHDKTIKLWHLETGEHIGTLSGHLDSVNAVTFSPDGHFLASGSHDKTIKIWRAVG